MTARCDKIAARLTRPILAKRLALGYNQAP